MYRYSTFVIILLIPVFCTGQSGTYTNPVSDSLFAADPFVLFEEGVYYLYGTSANDGFRYWSSENLVDWKPRGYALKRHSGSWGRKSYWAPEVIKYNDQFYMIYSANGPTMYGDGLRLCIAVSDKPGGPFTDLYAPLFDLGFSCIDGHLFIDTDGRPYLYYEMVGAVGRHWEGKGYLWGVIMGVQLSPDLSDFVHEPKLCLYPSQEWEGLESMKARSNEGMTVIRHEGTYYMTYSANHYTDPDYGIGYAIAEAPLGMWSKYQGNPVMKKDTLAGVSGPGHNSIIKSPDQREFFIVYHSHADTSNPSGRRVVNIDRMTINKDGSISIMGPTRTPQPLPSNQ